METISKSNGQRRIRRSREEWRSLVARFEESGQTREAFCAETGVAVSTLRRWSSRFRQKTPTAVRESAVFLELPAEEQPAQAPVPPWEVELQLGEGVWLRLRRV